MLTSALFENHTAQGKRSDETIRIVRVPLYSQLHSKQKEGRILERGKEVNRRVLELKWGLENLYQKVTPTTLGCTMKRLEHDASWLVECCRQGGAFDVVIYWRSKPDDWNGETLHANNAGNSVRESCQNPRRIQDSENKRISKWDLERNPKRWGWRNTGDSRLVRKKIPSKNPSNKVNFGLSGQINPWEIYMWFPWDLSERRIRLSMFELRGTHLFLKPVLPPWIWLKMRKMSLNLRADLQKKSTLTDDAPNVAFLGFVSEIPIYISGHSKLGQ